MSDQNPELEGQPIADPEQGQIYQSEQRPPTQEPQAPDPVAAPKAAESQTVKIDPESLAQITAAAQPKQPVAADPQARKRLGEMSAEEIGEVLAQNNVVPWQATRDYISATYGIDPDEVTDQQINNTQELYNSAVNHSLTMAALVAEERVNDVMARVVPIERHFSQQEQQSAFNGLFQAYPTLKQYPKAVAMAAVELKQAIAAGKIQAPADVAATYKLMADQTMSTLQELGVPIQEGQSNAPVIPFQPQPSQGYTGPVYQAGVPTMAAGINSGRSQQGGVGGQPNNPDADIYGKSGQ
jgi:hypothetical protein